MATHLFAPRRGPPAGALELAHRSRKLNDLALHASNDLHKLQLFLAPHLVFFEGCNEQVISDLPIRFGDAEPFVGRLHVASGVDARPPSQLTQEIDEVLAEFFEAPFAMAGKDPAQLLVGPAPR